MTKQKAIKNSLFIDYERNTWINFTGVKKFENSIRIENEKPFKDLHNVFCVDAKEVEHNRYFAIFTHEYRDYDNADIASGKKLKRIVNYTLAEIVLDEHKYLETVTYYKTYSAEKMTATTLKKQLDNFGFADSDIAFMQVDTNSNEHNNEILARKALEQIKAEKERDSYEKYAKQLVIVSAFNKAKLGYCYLDIDEVKEAFSTVAEIKDEIKAFEA